MQQVKSTHEIGSEVPQLGREELQLGREELQLGREELQLGSEELQLTPHESVTIRSLAGDSLEVEARWAPNGAAPPKHFHPEQDERFEVLEGSLRVRVDGQERVLAPGDVLEIPRGAVHQMWNEGDVPARAIWRTSPAGRTAAWFADLAALRRSGRVGRNGMPGPLAFGAYLTEYRDVIRLAGPQPVMRAAFAVLGTLGRLRGYRPATDGSPAAHWSEGASRA